MSEPMSSDELKACRERAEAATGLSPSDVRGGAFTWDGDEALLADVVATADALAALRADANRLLATIAARDEEIAEQKRGINEMIEGLFNQSVKIDALRHAALFAAGVRGGPGAWRWAHDKRVTILDDGAAWERLLGEMRDLGSVEAIRKLRWSVVANAGRLSLRGPAPRWSHVMSAAGLGSTSAKALCVAAGFDPDEEIGKWPEPCETCAEEEEDEAGEDE